MKSKSASKKKAASKSIDRPVSAKMLRRAEQFAARYRVILEPHDELGYVGRGVELPNALGDGKTPNQCVKSVRGAMVAIVGYLLEEGRIPPAPSSNQTRKAQINIRVTEEEKALLENAARSRGYRGVSDFIRSSSLASIK